MLPKNSDRNQCSAVGEEEGKIGQYIRDHISLGDESCDTTSLVCQRRDEVQRYMNTDQSERSEIKQKHVSLSHHVVIVAQK